MSTIKKYILMAHDAAATVGHSRMSQVWSSNYCVLLPGLWGQASWALRVWWGGPPPQPQASRRASRCLGPLAFSGIISGTLLSPALVPGILAHVGVSHQAVSYLGQV